jgi:hypothetical protein
MNCSVCGKPLLFNRVAFKCSCGAYVHAYCLDQHVLEAHRPEVEEGYVDLNSDFHPVKAAEPEIEAVEEASLTDGFELPEEVEAVEGIASEIDAESGEQEGEDQESEEDLSPGDMVDDEAEDKEADAASDDED